MFPGICIPPEGFPSFAAGEPWAVKVPGNPSPIAVGIWKWTVYLSVTKFPHEFLFIVLSCNFRLGQLL